MTAGVRIGVLGCGSVFEAYAVQLRRLEVENRAEVVALHDPRPDRREVARGLFPSATVDENDEFAVINSPELDVICILTSMQEHASLAIAALQAGKHVLLEKPMAVNLSDARKVMSAARSHDRLLVCAPHVLLSPTFGIIRERILAGDIGSVVSGRGRYGWRGPDWASWFYQEGGGSIFDLGVYNIMSLCGLFGSVTKVTAMVGTAVPKRLVGGDEIDVQVEDNAHVILDFGNSRFASVITGFVMENYRSPALELYGTDGVIQLLGDDWAPQGYELFRRDRECWETYAETAPTWPWTDGVRHLIDCLERNTQPVTRPEHAYHVLEVMLAAKTASSTGEAQLIDSDFPTLDFGDVRRGSAGPRHHHDPRNA